MGCLYANDWWVLLDNSLFVLVWAALLFGVWKLRMVHDKLGEYANIRKATHISLGCLSILVFVELGSLDGIWIGRGMVTTAVACCVATFFYMQNRETIAKLMAEDDPMDEDVQE